VTLDISSLEKAMKFLEDAVAVVGDKAWFDAQPEPVRNTLLSGAVQSIEFVYELGVKMIRRRIEQDSGSPATVDFANFRDMIRIAAEMGILSNVEGWFAHREMRNATSHTYDREKAWKVYRQAGDLLRDARDLVKMLKARNG
jgi:nucleotidyltransferase substrate binding protein (TIGR01987 family)